MKFFDIFQVIQFECPYDSSNPRNLTLKLNPDRTISAAIGVYLTNHYERLQQKARPFATKKLDCLTSKS